MKKRNRMMKGHYRIIAVTMALFSACSSEDDIKPIYTVGEADNVITLRVGVSTGESAVQTRATDSDPFGSPPAPAHCP